MLPGKLGQFIGMKRTACHHGHCFIILSSLEGRHECTASDTVAYTFTEITKTHYGYRSELLKIAGLSVRATTPAKY